MDTSQEARVTARDKAAPVVTVQRRQRWSIAEKKRMVEATLIAGASVARVARTEGVNTNQLFGRRRLYLARRLGQPRPGVKLLPVRVSEFCQEDEKSSCCRKDEGGPFGAAL